MRGARIWFADSPAVPTQSRAEDDSSRQFAIVDGKAWFVEQIAIHRAQQERPYETSVMPHSFLNAAVYSLSTHGWEIPDRLRTLTLERDTPLDRSLQTAEAVLVRLGGQWLLGHQYGVDGYRSIATIFEGRWLYALCPDTVALPLELSTYDN